MAQIQFEEIKDKIKITERSLLSERFVFIEAIKSLNFIDKTQYHILVDWFNLVESKVPPVNEVIYLRTSPEIAFNRLKLRNRPEEQTVSLEYIQLLFNLYENWLIHQTFGELPFKVTIVDQDKDLESFNQEMSTLTNRLEAILNG
jgi:deoxynucleoside kinase